MITSLTAIARLASTPLPADIDGRVYFDVEVTEPLAFKDDQTPFVLKVSARNEVAETVLNSFKHSRQIALLEGRLDNTKNGFVLCLQNIEILDENRYHESPTFMKALTTIHKYPTF